MMALLAICGKTKRLLLQKHGTSAFQGISQDIPPDGAGQSRDGMPGCIKTEITNQPLLVAREQKTFADVQIHKKTAIEHGWFVKSEKQCEIGQNELTSLIFSPYDDSRKIRLRREGLIFWIPSM